MAYKIAFFDIDGTLVNEEKQIPQDAIAAIHELKARGVEAVIATGRAPYFFKPIADELGIDSYVSLNGAYVVYKGKAIFKRAIPRDSMEQLVRHAASNNHFLVFEGEQFYYSNTEDHPFMLSSVDSLKVDRPHYDPAFWESSEVFQVFLHCGEAEEHLYIGSIPSLRFVRWHPNAMDVLPTDGSKALGIQYLLESLGIKPEEAVAFGDGLNDKEMLEYVGLGIAMGNSHPELLVHADYVTTSVDEEGIRNGLIHAGLLEAQA
ncbi:Cof-type HAD-IIB family hydrolase [Paenibacillus sp. GCM10012307]|uniref:Cof-type HAD-IIB family hydrolase n=1 Tax=Paenibacillus roseus TaxID=2798579 RepID=A0A934MUD3_9BACL|nr:Cof-type HAD-IIB family hydrolase [Paenibacillus roseus]MBJ6360972.1 Cof-type HAD-IIB family hydrolase [Paenibacillus roseus]